MAKEFGVRTSGFSRVRLGIFSQTAGWKCVDPLTEFEAAKVDHAKRVGSAAATRVAKNAAALGMTVEEYSSLPYYKRSQLRKAAGIAVNG
jgi:hypothetical protein